MSALVVESVEAAKPRRIGAPMRELVTAIDPSDRESVQRVEFYMPLGSLKVGDSVTVSIESVDIVIEPRAPSNP